MSSLSAQDNCVYPPNINVNKYFRDLARISKSQLGDLHYFKSCLENNKKTYSAFVSGVGKSPIVVKVRVDQYKLPKYFLVSVA